MCLAMEKVKLCIKEQKSGLAAADVNIDKTTYFQAAPTVSEYVLTRDESKKESSPPASQLKIVIETELTETVFHYKIRFKRTTRTFEVTSEQQELFKLQLGTFVEVQADRGGKDHGMLVDRQTVTSGGRSARYQNKASPEQEYNQQCILRATSEEVAQFAQKEQDERTVQATILGLVEEMDINVSILDVEYQFDRRKLTVFYELSKTFPSKELVDDINRLSQKLQCVVKTRVWMQLVQKGDPFLPPINLTATLLRLATSSTGTGLEPKKQFAKQFPGQGSKSNSKDTPLYTPIQPLHTRYEVIV